jgi:arsenite/tail-anchored protein-transporting ATPase
VLKIARKRVYQKEDMAFLNINAPSVRLIMVGGKGGVGKTTCAAAIAYQKALEGKTVLIVSSDPTPSLSDIFDIPLGNEERPICSDLRLFGMEISSELVLERWKERFGPEIYEVISSFADVDYDFVDYIGTAPGIEEEYMLSFIVDLVESGVYDVVVWDTAPAGHTLKLLSLPRLFLKHLEAATKFYLNMFSYLEKLRDTVRLKTTKRTLLEVIAGWEALSERIVRFIRDRDLTSYVLVTIPEALGVRLTERVMAEFHLNDLKVGNLIVNYVIREVDCEFHKTRKAMQDHYLDMLSQLFSEINMVKLYLRPHEVKGLQSIAEVAGALFHDGPERHA